MTVGGLFEIETSQTRLKQLQQQQQDPELWQDQTRAAQIGKEISRIERRINPWRELRARVDEGLSLAELAADEGDASLEEEIRMTLEECGTKYQNLDILDLFKEPLDECNCYITIHSGAGGTESCDWADMLLRMYLRWMERFGLEGQLLEVQPGDEAGVKSATVLVKGDYAYGYLQAESGVHRLVRKSPFDSAHRRHTSFASVYCSPEVADDIEVDINPADLRIDTYRASGAGGQHVNKTSSAVRITHQPSGIVVACQNERSQHQNKEMAIKILRSRLYEKALHERQQELDARALEKSDIGWGSQIRSYVFEPYTLIKDHRTNIETGNVKAVMDGDLDQFIIGYLRSK